MKVPKARKLNSGSWFIQLRLGGTSIPVTAETERDCIREAELLKAQYRANAAIPRRIATDRTLGQSIDIYVKHRPDLSPSTVRGYNGIKRNRFKDVMDAPVKNVKDWQKVVDAEARLCSPKTLKNAWGLVSTVLTEVCEFTPPRVRLPKYNPAEKAFLDFEQIPVFLEAIKGDPAEIAALLMLHSLRSSEMMALTWERHIDLRKRIIKVDGAVVLSDSGFVHKKQNKTSASKRTVPIMIDRLYELLDAEPDKTGPVIRIAAETITRRINRVCEASDLPPVGSHGLRHSFASLAYHLEMPEKIAMQIGGWSDGKTMHDIYTHLARADITKYENKMAEFYKNANKNAN